jgi:hypothetical protein
MNIFFVNNTDNLVVCAAGRQSWLHLILNLKVFWDLPCESNRDMILAIIPIVEEPGCPHYGGFAAFDTFFHNTPQIRFRVIFIMMFLPPLSSFCGFMLVPPPSLP